MVQSAEKAASSDCRRERMVGGLSRPRDQTCVLMVRLLLSLFRRETKLDSQILFDVFVFLANSDTMTLPCTTPSGGNNFAFLNSLTLSLRRGKSCERPNGY